MTATFQLAGRTSAGDLHALARPLPPRLVAALGDDAAGHAELARRFGEATAKQVALERQLGEAERADAQAGRRALQTGRPLPASKVAKLQTEIEASDHELELLRAAIPESARELLELAAPHAERVAEEAAAAADELEQSGLELLAQASDALAAADELRAEAAWVGGLADRGIVRPWMGARGAAGPGSIAVTEATRAVAHERDRRHERRDELEHERRALNTYAGRELPEPPDRASLDELARDNGVDLDGLGAQTVDQKLLALRAAGVQWPPAPRRQVAAAAE